MNRVRQEFSIVQKLVEAEQRLPTNDEIEIACEVSSNRVSGIIRRYMIYQYINKYSQLHGYPPTRREISEMLHIPLSVTQYHFDKLVKANLIHWKPYQSRSIRVSKMENHYG